MIRCRLPLLAASGSGLACLAAAAACAWRLAAAPSPRMATPAVATAVPDPLPEHLEVMKFAEARAREIAAAEAGLVSSGLAAQPPLGRHLRRRTRSHVPFKLP